VATCGASPAGCETEYAKGGGGSIVEVLDDGSNCVVFGFDGQPEGLNDIDLVYTGEMF
jgi:hypothetical protein